MCVTGQTKIDFAFILQTAYRAAGFRVNVLKVNTEIALKN